MEFIAQQAEADRDRQPSRTRQREHHDSSGQ
jgi:hypothetical protein